MFFSLLSVSCQEWLDVSPSTEVKYDDLFSYKNGFKDQLTGVYTALCSEELYGAHLGFGMLDALGQQYFWNQEAGTYYYLHRFVYDNPKSEEVINSIWNNMYNTIANVNILLQGIEDHRGVLTADEEKIYELQQRKAELTDNMLSTQTTFINKLSKDDIMNLFS